MTAVLKKEKGLKKNQKDDSLSTEQVEAIHNSFCLIDKNGDGRISKKELSKAAAVLGWNPTTNDINEMFETCDINDDGYIDYDEYTLLMKRSFCPIEDERNAMAEAFRILDRDNDGFVTTKELRAVLLSAESHISEEEVDMFLLEADKDGDGKIDYEEFINSTLVTALV